MNAKTAPLTPASPHRRLSTRFLRPRAVKIALTKPTLSYTANKLDRTIVAGSEKLYFLSVGFSSGGGVPLPASILADRSRKRNRCEVTILFVPVSVALERLAAGWAEDSDEIILRRCPVCEKDSIVGHGRRRKQAHDEHHDWIRIRRGRCGGCGTTFTFLPVFSLPYTHYSLLARCQALLRRFVEHCSWEKALPKLQDPDRLPDPSTVRRWSSGLDCSHPAPSFLSQTVSHVAHWLMRSHQADGEAGPLRWITPVLKDLWPLRL